MKKMYLYIKESPFGLKYLGKTERNPFKYKGSGVYWKRHLKKYNLSSDDIKTTILFETFDKDELKSKGIYYSELYNIVKSDDWANLREENGDGGDTSHCPNYKKPPVMRGDKNWTRNMTEEQRKIMSDRLRGDNNPAKRAEVREKIRNSSIGRKASEETKLKLSESKKGDKNNFYAKKHKIEDVLKMKEKAKGRYTIEWFINRYGDADGIIKRNEFLERSKNAAKLNKGILKKEQTCPICGMVGRGGNMKRYHFDNCKLK